MTPTELLARRIARRWAFWEGAVSISLIERGGPEGLRQLEYYRRLHIDFLQRAQRDGSIPWKMIVRRNLDDPREGANAMDRRIAQYKKNRTYHRPASQPHSGMNKETSNASRTHGSSPK